MEIRPITPASPKWNQVAEYAQGCSWKAGKALAEKMLAGHFTSWERVIVAWDKDQIAGYCTVTKTDCLPNVPYIPYLGFVFVGEGFRGNRLSQRLLCHGERYLRKLGFSEVFLVSDHDGLYEKYGYQAIDRQPAPWGSVEKIYRKYL